MACKPEAWPAGAAFMLLETLLGLEPDAVRGNLVIRRPSLPDWIGGLGLENLRVGGVPLSLRVGPGGAGHPLPRVELGDADLAVTVEARR